MNVTLRSAEALLLRRPRCDAAASGGCNVEVCSTAVTTPSLKGASRMEKEGAPGGVRRGLGSSVLTKLLATLATAGSSSPAASGTNIAILDRRDLMHNRKISFLKLPTSYYLLT